MTAKKSPTRKVPTSKKPAAASTTSKRTASNTSKHAAKSTKSREMRSFRLAKSPEPFMTFRITRQTIYWLVLGVIVLSFGSWLIYVTAQIQSIYDQIDQTNAIVNDLSPETLKKIKEHRSITAE